MHQSSGEIGTILQDGKQIGGFKPWTIILILNELDRTQGKEYKKALTTSKSQQFWLFEEPTGELTAQYFTLVKGTLVMVSQSKVKIIFPEYELNKMINHPLEIIWTE